MHRIEKEFAGRTLIIETGRMARLAQGSALVQYGDTQVLCAVTVQDRPTHLPFFPLTVEYREKSYAAGKIPGGFFKREGRPGEKEILSARQIDRPLRPLFPEGFMHETQVNCQILSADQENDADVLALTAASVALNISKVPFDTMVASVRVGRIRGTWILNPTFQQLEYSDVDIIVAGSRDALMMVEGGAVEVPEDEILQGLEVAHEGIRQLIDIQEELIGELRQPAMSWTPQSPDKELSARVEEMASARMDEAMTIADKADRMEALGAVKTWVREELEGEMDADAYDTASRQVGDILRSYEKKSLREKILSSGSRTDGRDLDTVRDITCETGVVPRAHGSALFTRGQTQALVAATLGTSRDEQRIDSIDSAEEITKSFMLHYNFPPFCTGEAKPIRGTSRREIGHGALAERALQPLLPAFEEFPYTIRIVADILESNGSSSMASVCGASLALMTAGVPLSASCAGVAMGLIKDGDRVAILTDILGIEDALGDMDFKIAGTRQGVTSIQMDIKIDGLTTEIMKTAMERANRARLHILDIMDAAVSEPAAELSEWAPRITTIKVNPEKLGEIIGPKGKTIRAIQDESGAKIEIDDSGLVKIAAVSAEAAQRAREMIEAIVQEPEVGRIYEGPVKNTTTFGAFIEILPGLEGLCHISELSDDRVEKTEDVLNRGDITRVKLLAIDEKGRLRLSRRAALAEDAAEGTEAEEAGVGAD
ncbi:MAG: polyribonucleotide nucleotidyltransferase [Gemmatimonadales bacterium]|nr:MAG: polyribonucleotide nucleotidyltransferase [Gemmatimonadales bacterium]